VIERKLEGRIEIREGEQEDVSSYCLSSNKRRYWKFKEEALDHTLWRTRFGRGYVPVVRQTAKRMKCVIACNVIQ
jgi:hypothetical protein